MGPGSSPAMRALRRAQAAARYARRTGCDIGEATSVLAEQAAGPARGEQPGGARTGDGLSRREVLGGAAGAGLAAAAAASWPVVARAAVRTGPRVVIIGSGIAGLGCADRLQAPARHRAARSTSTTPTGPAAASTRCAGFFAAGQYAEEHGEFISSEHTPMRRLAASFGLTLDNVNAYPPHTHADGLPVAVRRPVLAAGGAEPGLARVGLAAVP